MQDEQPPVEITVYENGPVIVRGAYKLQNRDRREINPGRETIALCRCGLSALKPFCDGNHALRGAARSELRADPEGGFPLQQARAPKLSITLEPLCRTLFPNNWDSQERPANVPAQARITRIPLSSAPCVTTGCERMPLWSAAWTVARTAVVRTGRRL